MKPVQILDAEAGTGEAATDSEFPPPAPRKMRRGCGTLSRRQDPFHPRLRKGGWERVPDLCKLGERWVGGSGTLEKWSHVGRGWASCPVGEEGSSSASFPRSITRPCPEQAG